MKKNILALTLLTAVISLSACQNILSGSALPIKNQPLNVQAQNARGLIDDSDISGGFQPQSAARLDQEVLRQQGDEVIFRAQQIRPVSRLQDPQQDLIRGRLVFSNAQGEMKPAAMASAHLYQDNRRIASALTDQNGQWSLPVPPNGQYDVRYTLENPRWKISKYSWQGPQANIQGAVDLGETSLIPGSENAKAAWIHEVYLKTMALFEQEQVPLDWWKTQIATIWPGQGNYYTSYTVNLTGAEQWDVNGHEIGHAIYAQALNAASTGGYHKIDECYSATLALSEGFATFFSGAVHLSKDDPDARFDQFLVPRRAPIRIENVPDDVCPGSQNEWRVSAAFWEIYDTHSEAQDHLSLGLKTIFEALGRDNRPTSRNAIDAFERLKEVLPTEQHAALLAAFAQNTMEVK